ncbi:Flp family type IVb pilin [Aureimonas jatrophae]|jgi:pilus assembly protein Flp/PilA|uniref:Pilus assembly protein Flp/PilA n=1 Tax=Aureimonas jatrophae TaxID=1166073 RepID=A0A1H0I953_9HYPH|nr:Flp family type IVb pilin [Aureimonas jatrophae]MBB3952051.1 pilus assembly protein Flp/PilA [Aureimonas jatrophae]SDO27937.1 pilus assembly protein Flp/PilA [Aureimonas jatrophae]
MIRLAAFCRDRSGATAIEYGLIAALIATAIIGALTATGTSVGDQWEAWTSAVSDALTRGD